MGVNVKQLNSLALAYIGDAVYEVHVRHHLIESGGIRPNDLHQKAVSFVSATAQAAIIHDWLDREILSEEEAGVVRRVEMQSRILLRKICQSMHIDMLLLLKH